MASSVQLAPAAEMALGMLLLAAGAYAWGYGLGRRLRLWQFALALTSTLLGAVVWIKGGEAVSNADPLTYVLLVGLALAVYLMARRQGREHGRRTGKS